MHFKVSLSIQVVWACLSLVAVHVTGKLIWDTDMTDIPPKKVLLKMFGVLWQLGYDIILVEFRC